MRTCACIVILLSFAGCADIPLRTLGPPPDSLKDPLQIGMTADQVHRALGQPDYTEPAKNLFGSDTSRSLEIYQRSIPSEHFVVELVVIACGERKVGVVQTYDDYKILVGYDKAGYVDSRCVVPAWLHGREP